MWNGLITTIVAIVLMSSFAFAGNLEPFTAVPIPEQNPQTAEKIELGKKLFFDRRLSGDGTGTAARFYSPSGITTDGTNLYVTDLMNHTIRKIVIASGAVTTLAGTVGIADFMDGTGTAASFNRPYGITTDGTHLYVADTDNNTIRTIVIASGAVTTLAGTSAGYGSTDGTGAAASFNRPHGITGNGTNLYVADTFNHAIRKISF